MRETEIIRKVQNILHWNKICIFATTVRITLPIRIASQGASFAQNVIITQDNTPSLPLYDAHLGGFFIYIL